MNSFRIHSGAKKRRGGFSPDSASEATFSIGLLSFGFLTLAPLLALGLKTARLARDDRAAAQIAQTMIEEAQAGDARAGNGLSRYSGAPPAAPPRPPTRRKDGPSRWRPRFRG